MAEPFRVITDDETEPKPSRVESVGINALMIGLGALSQRAVIGLSKLFTLLTVASAFMLWWSVLPNPSILQLVGLGLYAVFVLAANIIARKV
jgi:hypothetical protein